MPHCIARIFEQLLRLLLPAHGDHRAAVPTPIAVILALPDTAAPTCGLNLLRGEDSALVRPYLVAHEQHLRRQRRRTLCFAPYGIHLDTRDIRGTGAA